MGSSKIIMLSGVYLIFGFYTIAFNRADEMMFKTSVKSAALGQTEQLSLTGLALAKGYMGGNSGRDSYPWRTFVSGIDTVKYSATQPAGFPSSQTQVTSIATHTTTVTTASGPVVTVRRQVTQTAVFQFNKGRWKQMRVYTESDYQDTF